MQHFGFEKNHYRIMIQRAEIFSEINLELILDTYQIRRLQKFL